MAPKACAIKAPGFGENRTRNLGDLAILTGGEVIPEDLGLNLEKVQLEMFGAATKVTASLDDTVVQHGEGGKKLRFPPVIAVRDIFLLYQDFFLLGLHKYTFVYINCIKALYFVPTSKLYWKCFNI
ncbi:chaperonin CPN60, mitochondrial-like isoform X2 [Phoenix dactylifera]|uniref:Chaperonin CPN60, mitochondrial-like isoform X2 n=1 Tax=Phoenix dactylifera TaxID=42345 RepID=A0A8B9A3I9_PHODC|nr:chaperonin CPN60, mitochondrial-like isoform X2 [Phoenix dactylifera]